MSADRIVEMLIDYIEDNLDKDLTLDKIANDLNYSKFYLERIFSQKTGITIYKYIKARRLTLAALKLVEGKKPIVEIAYEAKYNSQQAFTLAFSRLYLCTPQTYRKNASFYPKQRRIDIIDMRIFLRGFGEKIHRWGGKMAA